MSDTYKQSIALTNGREVPEWVDVDAIAIDESWCAHTSPERPNLSAIVHRPTGLALAFWSFSAESLAEAAAHARPPKVDLPSVPGNGARNNSGISPQDRARLIAWRDELTATLYSAGAPQTEPE